MDKSWISTVAGVLDILAGGLAVVAVGLFSLAVFVLNTVPDIDQSDFGIVIAKTVLISSAGVFLVIALLAIVGGMSALSGRRWGWALAGSIAAAFAFPPLGIPAIVLTVLAEKELNKPKP